MRIPKRLATSSISIPTCYPSQSVGCVVKKRVQLQILSILSAGRAIGSTLYADDAGRTGISVATAVQGELHTCRHLFQQMVEIQAMFKLEFAFQLALGK